MSVAVTETIAGMTCSAMSAKDGSATAGGARPGVRGRRRGGGRGGRLLGRGALREVEGAGEDHPEDDRAREESGERQNLRFRTHTVHR